MIEIEVKKRLPSGVMDISLTLKKGEFLGLMGASGSGKTTFLRIVAGLEEAQGEIVVENEVWLDEKSVLPPQKRSIGFVFQEYALFENMQVIENLLYVASDEGLAEHLLKTVELWELRYRFPSQLSGGQKQRVALARALMRRPKLLLLDEPLSALDRSMRRKLQEEIKILHKEFGTTTIMVSHDWQELFYMADSIVELVDGRVQRKWGSGYEEIAQFALR